MKLIFSLNFPYHILALFLSDVISNSQIGNTFKFAKHVPIEWKLQYFIDEINLGNIYFRLQDLAAA